MTKCMQAKRAWSTGGKLSVSAAPSLVKDVAWSELSQIATAKDEDATSGLGSLRAYKPGE